MTNKLIIVAHQSHTLVNLRWHLIQDFVRVGLQVIALAPQDQYFVNAQQQLQRIGVALRPISLSNTSLNMFGDIKLYFSLKRHFREIKPDFVFLYAIKPVIFGSFAAKFDKKIKRFVLFPGLGYVFTGNSYKHGLLRFVIKRIYKRILSGANKVFFHNRDDADLFIRNALVKKKQVVLTGGSGVDVQHFAPSPYPEQLSFLFVGRLIRDKGINEFIEAAKQIKQKNPQIRFLIAGGIHNNPTGLSPEELQQLIQKNIIEYLGELTDIREALKQASVFVLPSYREGLPRAALEAMAAARPIITTDAPGCREVVQPGKNGFLVRVKDIDELVAAMHYFVLHPEMITTMGSVSRQMAVTKFDVAKINQVMLEAMCLSTENLNLQELHYA